MDKFEDSAATSVETSTRYHETNSQELHRHILTPIKTDGVALAGARLRFLLRNCVHN
jgi:hypothetical protein